MPLAVPVRRKRPTSVTRCQLNSPTSWWSRYTILLPKPQLQVQVPSSLLVITKSSKLHVKSLRKREVLVALNNWTIEGTCYHGMGQRGSHHIWRSVLYSSCLSEDPHLSKMVSIGKRPHSFMDSTELPRYVLNRVSDLDECERDASFHHFDNAVTLRDRIRLKQAHHICIISCPHTMSIMGRTAAPARCSCS